jgi:hypothetical protein
MCFLDMTYRVELLQSEKGRVHDMIKSSEQEADG